MGYAATDLPAALADSSTALESARQTKGEPCRVYVVLVHNTGPAQFVQVHDAASTPAEAAVPLARKRVAADADAWMDLGVRGVKLANGLYVCNSSTAATKTLGAADCLFTVLWR